MRPDKVFTDEEVTTMCNLVGWTRTGVWASEEDAAIAKSASDSAAQVPAMQVGGVWLHEQAERALVTILHAMAMRYGLPAPEEGCFYGILGLVVAALAVSMAAVLSVASYWELLVR